MAAAPRTRWPYQGAPQVLLLVAGLTTIIGTTWLPWVSSPLGSLGDGTPGELITLYAAFVAIPGAVWRRARTVAIHAAILAVPALVFPLHRLVWALRTVPAFGDAWLPGTGMVVTLVSGGTALYCAIVLLRRARRGAA